MCKLNSRDVKTNNQLALVLNEEEKICDEKNDDEFSVEENRNKIFD